jgi:branched-subunit amino acid ABC-type transport system permease component
LALKNALSPLPSTPLMALLLNAETLLNVALMIILCIGFTFTYMMEGFPNFAHTGYASIGALVSFYITRIVDLNPYLTWPFSALAGGAVGVLLYVCVVRPIKRDRGYQDITLTLTFLVVAQVIPSLCYIFNFWSRFTLGHQTRNYSLGSLDFTWNGFKGITIAGPIMCLLLVIGVHLLLTKTRLGLSLRATSENENLASAIGVNTFRAHCASWFLSGALAALAGSIITIYKGVGVEGADGLIINVMSGAILGGLDSIYGAIIGGIFIAVAQDALGQLIYMTFGLAYEAWKGLLPLAFLLIATAFFPNGLTSHGDLNIQSLRRRVLRILGIRSD